MNSDKIKQILANSDSIDWKNIDFGAFKMVLSSVNLNSLEPELQEKARHFLTLKEAPTPAVKDPAEKTEPVQSPKAEKKQRDIKAVFVPIGVIALLILIGIVIFLIISNLTDDKTTTVAKTLTCENESTFFEELGFHESNRVEMKFDVDDNLLEITQIYIEKFDDEDEFKQWSHDDFEREIAPGVTEKRVSSTETLTIVNSNIQVITKMTGELNPKGLPTTYDELRTFFEGQLRFTCN
jgi:hypothetical protein